MIHPMKSQLTFLMFDEHDDECLKVKTMMDEMGMPHMIVPCRGIVEPSLLFRGVRYDGMEWITKLLAELKRGYPEGLFNT